MKLFLVERTTDRASFDQFRSMIVAAIDAEAARLVHPFPEGPIDSYGPVRFDAKTHHWRYVVDDDGTDDYIERSWPMDVRTLRITEIGTANPGVEGVVHTDFFNG